MAASSSVTFSFLFFSALPFFLSFFFSFLVGAGFTSSDSESEPLATFCFLEVASLSLSLIFITYTYLPFTNASSSPTCFSTSDHLSHPIPSPDPLSVHLTHSLSLSSPPSLPNHTLSKISPNRKLQNHRRPPPQSKQLEALNSTHQRFFFKKLTMTSTTETYSDSINPQDVCIVGIARTPIGGFLGPLSSFSATQLGSIAIASALKRANVDPSLVQEVFFGNVLSANLGQAPARQAALGAGIPNSVICTTINKVCSSGMKATMLAAQTIQLGSKDVVVAGGMESMSNAPKYLAEARRGSRLGHDTIIDGMLKDGLWDVYNDFGMGVCAELCADQQNITRAEQDAYAIQSFDRGIAAQRKGAFAWEIVPVTVGGRGKPAIIINADEGLGKFDAAKLRKLRPSFKESGGSVTAGNASSISDGAAALVLVSGKKASELGLQVIAKIRGYDDAAQAPELFTTAPALAIPKAITNAGLEASQIDYYEINEAFSVVALANRRLLGISPEKLNVHGGAVSLGHPLGCSGARILVTLLGVLRHKNGKFGVAGICNGGGGASAIVVELMPVLKVGRSLL